MESGHVENTYDNDILATLIGTQHINADAVVCDVITAVEKDIRMDETPPLINNEDNMHGLPSIDIDTHETHLNMFFYTDLTSFSQKPGWSIAKTTRSVFEPLFSRGIQPSQY